jgi:hypothetical protein
MTVHPAPHNGEIQNEAARHEQEDREHYPAQTLDYPLGQALALTSAAACSRIDILMDSKYAMGVSRGGGLSRSDALLAGRDGAFGGARMRRWLRRKRGAPFGREGSLGPHRSCDRSGSVPLLTVQPVARFVVAGVARGCLRCQSRRLSGSGRHPVGSYPARQSHRGSWLRCGRGVRRGSSGQGA